MKLPTFLFRLAAAGTASVLASLTLAGCSGAGATSAPFSDPNAVGYIGLCNQRGQQIRTGSIDSTPFAWRAVSSQAAEPPYNNSYRTAILLAYQPRQGLVSGEWSGEELTASSRYTNPVHPMVAATDGDDSLAAFLSDYHAVLNGFLELRIYLGTADAEAYSEHYPMLAIQVTGNTWHAVGGGSVNCRSGTAESIESIVLPKTDISRTTTTTTADGSANVSTATGGNRRRGHGRVATSSGGSSTGGNRRRGQGRVATSRGQSSAGGHHDVGWTGNGSPAQHTSSGSLVPAALLPAQARGSSGLPPGAWAGIGAGVLALLAASGFSLTARRRRLAGLRPTPAVGADPTSPDRNSTKGQSS